MKNEKIQIGSSITGVTELDAEQWLWCLHCQRFFQAKSLGEDDNGGRQRCAFCDASGFHVDIWEWDAWTKDERWPKPHWPTEVESLYSGQLCLLYEEKGEEASDV